MTLKSQDSTRVLKYHATHPLYVVASIYVNDEGKVYKKNRAFQAGKVG